MTSGQAREEYYDLKLIFVALISCLQILVSTIKLWIPAFAGRTEKKMTKKILKNLLKYYLKFFTKLAILIHRPKIIAIAGSVNKSFFRDDIKATLLKKGYTVRANPKNFNTEIGLPLAILNLPSGYNSYKNWFPIIVKAPKTIFQKFPEFLVLELGVSDPGNMKYLLSLVDPDVAIITDITQRYVEGFDDMDELVGEYQNLIQKMQPKNLLIYNSGNSRIKKLAISAKCEKISFGIKNSADYQIVDLKKNEQGLKFSIKTINQSLDRQIEKFGEHHALSAAASQAIKDNYVSKQA